MFVAAIGTDRIPILLVEDSRIEAILTQKRLYDIDDEFRVLRATRFEEAVQYIPQQRIDAVILDLGLPDSDGPQAVKILSENFPQLPIIILSGRNDPETTRCAFAYGAEEFLSKYDCSANLIRQAILAAIVRKSLKN